MPAFKLATRIYIVFLVLCALGASGVWLKDVALPNPAHVLVALGFSGALALALLLPLPFTERTQLYLDTSIVLASVLIFDPGVAILVVVAGATLAQLIRREPLVQFAFNASQLLLEVSVAALVLRGFGWRALDPDFSRLSVLIGIILAGIAMHAVNALAVAIIVRIESPGRSAGSRQALQSIGGLEVLILAGQIGIGLLAGVIADVYLWALPLLLLPVFGMYVSLQHHSSIRRHVEETLRGTEANLREAQRIARLGSWEWNLVSGDRLWSDEALRIFGVDPGRVRSDRDVFIEVIHPGDRQMVEDTLGRALRGITPASMEHRIIRADGLELFVHTQIEVMFDAAGKPLRLLATVHDITERKQLEERLIHQAFHDPLTGLPNRALFGDRLQHALTRTQRQLNVLSVLFLDLDHFKMINDTLGHDAGDQVLIMIAERVCACVRPSDTVARLGGDEFTVLLEDLSDVYEAEQIAGRITDALARPVIVDGKELHVTTSIGIVVHSDEHHSADDLLRAADVALYRAKDTGKARYVIYDSSMGAAVLERVSLETDLRRAAIQGELLLHYQPQVDLASGAVIGVEALVRWNHPRRGPLSPAQFLPVAEETGLISTIDTWVLEESCRQGRRWQEEHGGTLTVSVNISARQLRRPELIESIGQVLHDTGFDAHNLKLEITEIAAMADTDATAQTLEALLGLSVLVMIDDFGTGYSSLKHLKRFPLAALKLDGSVVAGLGRDADARAVARAVINLAHGLDMKVIAEGIERIEQLVCLRELGCDYGQGNYFCEPRTAAALDSYLGGYAQSEQVAYPAD